jgi:hypothetical protein
MLHTIARGIAVAAATAALVGGVAAGAQAQVYDGAVQAHTQVMPRHDGREIEAASVAPNTRDMSAQGTKVMPQSNCDGWYYIDGWGVNLRSAPWGAIRGHANYGDSIYYLETQGDWSMINDYTANAWGVWIYNQYLGHETPTCIQ